MLPWKRAVDDDKSLSYSLFTWNRGILDLNLRNCLIDKHNYHDELSRKQREKERDFRNLKKMELLLKVSWDALTQTQALHQRLLLEVGAGHCYLVCKLTAIFLVLVCSFFPLRSTGATCGILVPWPGTESRPSAVRAQSPNHRQPGNSLGTIFLKQKYFKNLFLLSIGKEGKEKNRWKIALKCINSVIEAQPYSMFQSFCYPKIREMSYWDHASAWPGEQ